MFEFTSFNEYKIINLTIILGVFYENISKKFGLISLLFSLVMILSACSIIISNHDDTKPEIKTTISNQGFNKLEVSVALADISVKYGDKYQVEYEGPKNLKPTVRKNGIFNY